MCVEINVKTFKLNIKFIHSKVSYFQNHFYFIIKYTQFMSMNKGVSMCVCVCTSRMEKKLLFL